MVNIPWLRGAYLRYCVRRSLVQHKKIFVICLIEALCSSIKWKPCVAKKGSIAIHPKKGQ